ncbi:MAG: hypothetical protein OXI08_03910, partial [Cyanobacteria bacterium MAG IRC4_bin_6]|nr:hypothetical protein [Cyanobacteria bacterium MAG IRC4_bin_6]
MKRYPSIKEFKSFIWKVRYVKASLLFYLTLLISYPLGGIEGIILFGSSSNLFTLYFDYRASGKPREAWNETGAGAQRRAAVFSRQGCVKVCDQIRRILPIVSETVKLRGCEICQDRKAGQAMMRQK